MTKRAIRTFVLAAAVAATPLCAHHSFTAEFDADKPVKLRGKVTKVEFINPHSWIHIDVAGADGTLVNWGVEGGSPNALLRLGFTKSSLPIGTEIVVDGYQAKDSSNRAVGKDLTFADGRRLFLGGSAPGASAKARKKNNNGSSICLRGGYFHAGLAACIRYRLDALTVGALQFQWMRLWKNEDGGDVSEYTLLITFLLLVSACLFLSSATNVSSVWQAANSFISRGAGQSQSISTQVP